MSQHLHFSAIILAAGSSSRMGTPKQLLQVDGLCMLDLVIQTALQAVIGPPVVVLGANASQIEAASTQLNRCSVVHNHNYRSGLSTSLKAGIKSSPVQTNAYIFMLADLPLVSGTLLRKMIEEFVKTEADILYPEYQGQRGNPVIITSKLRNRLLKAKGDTGAKFLLADTNLAIVAYPVTTRAVITDIDTPEDFDNLCNRSLFYKGR